jgi:hypothetical protein
MRDDNVEWFEFEGKSLNIPTARLPASEPIQQKARLTAFRDSFGLHVHFNAAQWSGSASAGIRRRIARTLCDQRESSFHGQ